LKEPKHALRREFKRALRARSTSVAEWVFVPREGTAGDYTPANSPCANRGAVSMVIDELEAKNTLQRLLSK
jgi:hypothetical protein